MRKALRIIAVSAGIISIVSAVVLGYIYLEDIVVRINQMKSTLTSKINNKEYVGEEYDVE